MKKQAAVILISLLLLAATSFSSFLKGLYSKVLVEAPTIPLPFMNPTTPTPTPDPWAPYSIVVLGYGGGTHDGGSLTDTIIVSRIIPREKKLFLISIPRDLWIELPIKGTVYESHKINAAYAIGLDDRRYIHKPDAFTGKGGGGALAKYASGVVVGFPIDYFVSLSFNGFQKSIDTLGGVDVLVPHTFDDLLYPIESEKENNCGKTDEEIAETTATLSGELLEKEFPCRYEQLHFDKGLEHMDGTRALKFVRSRKSEEFGGDFNRSLRQLALLSAVKEKVISVNFIPKAFSFIQTLTSDMQTDIDIATINNKLRIHPDISSFEIKAISLTENGLLTESKSADGQYILIPTTSWEGIHSYINSELEAN